jgi:hypothetical protein
MKASSPLVFTTCASLVVAAAVIAGLFMIGSPTQIRAARLDEQRVNNLQALIDAIGGDHQRGDPLPASLAEFVKRPTHSYMHILDPETVQPYEFRVIDPDHFELCTQFAAAAKSPDRPESQLQNHASGRQCVTSEAKPRK